MKKILCFLIGIVTVIGCMGCSKGGSYTVIKATELFTSSEMTMTYEKFNGYRYSKITVKDSPVVVTVNIITTGGKLDAYIAKDNDIKNANYEGHDIQTSSFTVTLSEPGSYTIRTDGKNHSGSFSFQWK